MSTFFKGAVLGNLSKLKQYELPPNWINHKNKLKTLKLGINNKANTLEGTDRQNSLKHNYYTNCNCGV